MSEVRQPAHDSINVIHKLAVTTAAIPSADVGLADDNAHRAAIGTFDAWICSACGLTEWYAKDFAPAFERLCAIGKNRRIHVRCEERPPATPFR